MHAVASINTDNYQDLADLTDKPKQEYCDLHGYKFYVLKDTKYSPIMGFNKIHFVLDLFWSYPELEWLLFSECDAMITNLTIRIQDKIDNDYHFIVPVDSSIVKVVAQREMNSYEPHIYDYCDARMDILGNSGAWEPGDWIVHWPGTHKPIRLNRAETLSTQIVR